MSLYLLTAIALIANCKNRHMLILVAVVGASLIAEAPRSSYSHFYIFCIAAELTVALIAMWLKTNASSAVIVLCLAMVIVHISSIFFNAYPPLSPPRLIIPALEHAEIVACIVLSNPFIGRIRNHESPTI